LFNDPRFADAGVGRNRDHDLTDLALQLLPGTLAVRKLIAEAHAASR
jgi:hypothetical protein